MPKKGKKKAMHQALVEYVMMCHYLIMNQLGCARKYGMESTRKCNSGVDEDCQIQRLWRRMFMAIMHPSGLIV